MDMQMQRWRHLEKMIRECDDSIFVLVLTYGQRSTSECGIILFSIFDGVGLESYHISISCGVAS